MQRRESVGPLDQQQQNPQEEDIQEFKKGSGLRPGKGLKRKQIQQNAANSYNSMAVQSIEMLAKQAMDEQQRQLERIEAAKRFSEMKRLQAALNFNSTLEEAPWSQYIDDQENDQRELEELIIGATELGLDVGSSSSDSKGTSLANKKIIDEFRRFFFGRLYKFNHVLMDFQAVTRPFFHIILFIEFCQFLYFAFYNFNFIDEFQAESSQQTTSQESENSTSSSNKTSSTLDLSAIGEGSTGNFFRLDEYFKWANFAVYPLESHSTEGYIIIYSILCVIFYIFIGFLFLSANRLFRSSVGDDIKDGTQFLVKSCSVVMAIYLFLLQIPFTTVLFQGYLCSEGELESQQMVLKDISCGGTTNDLLAAVSTITLIAYILFLYIQSHLYNSTNLESKMPWTSLDRDIPVFRLIWKILLTCSFVFDKSGKLSDFTKLGAAGLGGIISVKRLSYALVLDKTVFNATAFYDLCISQLYLHLAFNNLCGYAVSIDKLVFLLSMTVFFSISAILISDKLRTIQIYREKQRVAENLHAKSPIQAQHVIHRMLKLIRSKKKEEKVMINGLVFNHFELCLVENCVCQDLITDLDGRIQRYQNQQEVLEAESARRIRQRYLRDSFGEDTGKNVYYNAEEGRFVEKQDSNKDDDVNFKSRASKRESVKLDGFSKTEIEGGGAATPRIAVQDPKYLKDLANSTETTNLQDFQISHIVAGGQGGPHLHTPMDISSQLTSLTNLEIAENKSKNAITLRQKSYLNLPKQRDSIQPIQHGSFNSLAKGLRENLVTTSNLGPTPISPYEAGQLIGMLKDGSVSPSKKIEKQKADDLVSVGLNNTSMVNDRTIESKHRAEAELIDEAQIDKLERNLRYRFLVLYVDKAIKSFPKSIDLRIHSSDIHCFKLDNEFKATFELMKCERDLPQNFQTRFFLFRGRLLIERNLFQRSQSYVSQGNIVNSYSVYNFEKLYQRFTKFSYLAANSALNFWRELLKKNIESQALIDRGSEISRIHTKIKEIANEIISINPNDIKFLLGYASFLWQIVHTEQEAQFVFEKAFQIYQRLPQYGQGSDGMLAHSTEKGNFGENSAVSIVIVALSAEEVGRIIHVSDEMQRALRHKRQNLIGKNISTITPTPIAIVHDRFLQNFLETAKSTMLNQSRQLFAMTADGYLRPIQVLLQLYPQMQERITILGFIQTIEKLDGIVPPKSIELPEELYQNQPHHYLMTDECFYGFQNLQQKFTDKCGNVNCISEGLKEIGLNSKFFMISNSKFKSVNIESLFGTDFTTPEAQEILMTDGVVTHIDTSGILEHVNIESISQQETMEAMERQGIYYIHIQLKRYISNIFSMPTTRRPTQVQGQIYHPCLLLVVAPLIAESIYIHKLILIFIILMTITCSCNEQYGFNEFFNEVISSSINEQQLSQFESSDLANFESESITAYRLNTIYHDMPKANVARAIDNINPIKIILKSNSLKDDYKVGDAKKTKNYVWR
ncbi:hypothetical protein FGO68_gene6410 [Halteria grandinella]|uniref:Uncharacterized protein n=1 Tax=Halteria grandinella TaxID=5974 RepID=A0A8J8TB49_HALGN|nr:hypothetical protein FGO68_gene6410 [Halteria grandinella]